MIEVTGSCVSARAGTANANLISGDIEILAKELVILNAANTPPFQIDDENLSELTRLQHRVIDLRRPAMQKNLRLRYKVALLVRNFLDSRGFIGRGNADADPFDPGRRA